MVDASNPSIIFARHRRPVTRALLKVRGIKRSAGESMGIVIEVVSVAQSREFRFPFRWCVIAYKPTLSSSSTSSSSCCSSISFNRRAHFRPLFPREKNATQFPKFPRGSRHRFRERTSSSTVRPRVFSSGVHRFDAVLLR